jgi:hypothetical protein
MNTENIGRLICRVKDNKDVKEKYSVAHSSEYPENLRPIRSVSIETGCFQYIPDKKRDRDTIFVCGSAGSGKSYWVASYIKEYHKTYSGNPVFMISEGEDDPVLDDLKFIKRISLEGILEDPIPFSDFSDCAVIFDDIDAISGKLGKWIYELRDKLLKNSRKKHVTVISTNHACTGRELKAVLNESNVIVFFMNNYNRSLKYLLREYVGVDKMGIAQLRKTKSRWCAFIKDNPSIILEEKNIQTISHLQKFDD